MKLWKYVLVLKGAMVLASAQTDSISPMEAWEKSRFNGQVFSNPRQVTKGFQDFLKWTLNREKSNWPREVPVSVIKKTMDCAPLSGMRITMIGHSSVLLQVDGRNFLFDPVWSERTSPFSWVGPRRVQAPAVALEALPHIHAVFLSHDHYDHMDMPTLRALHRRFAMPIYAGLGVNRHARGEKFSIVERDWWMRDTLSAAQGKKIVVHFAPARHFSGRWLNDRNTTLWGSWALESSQGLVYFAGDTGWDSHFELLRNKLGDPRVALIPIGAYEPRWFMAPVHLNPLEAVQAHLALGAEYSFGIHWGTVQLTDEDREAPVRDLEIALREKKVNPSRFRVLGFGQPYFLP